MPETHLKVILLKHTPHPEETVSMAAKLCYSPSDIEALQAKISQKDQAAFIRKLMEIGHLSPVEHVSFTFAVEGISRACSHQLVRHRIASYSQQSQRYVKEEDFDYIIPPAVAEDKAAKKIFEASMQEAREIYQRLIEKLNASGLMGESANQDARFVLPNAAETKIVITMNARELLHFFTVRCCNRAQWEIRGMAEAMLTQCKHAAPTLFGKAGPGCLRGPCPEGNYTCGKIKEVREKYGVTAREQQ